MPLLTNEVVRTYPIIGSWKTWEQIQEEFRLRMWQERCKALLNGNMKEVEKALKNAQGQTQSRWEANEVVPEEYESVSSSWHYCSDHGHDLTVPTKISSLL